MQTRKLWRTTLAAGLFISCYLVYSHLKSTTLTADYQSATTAKVAVGVEREPGHHEDTSVAATIAVPGKSFARGDTESAARPTQEDKIVVIAKLQHDDTEWVAKYLPEWQNAVYTVDNTSFPLHTNVNKGREANAYLTYLIQNYDRLPSTIAFVHSHVDGYPQAWHTDAAEHSNVKSLKNLNIEWVQANGYANLRCNWLPGCPDEILPFRNPPKYDHNDQSTERAMLEAWPLLFLSVRTPSIIAAACCGQFAVSRDQVRKRPLSDYQRFHRWLIATELPDDVSGRVFEYLWHIIFGQDPVYCPELQQCYTDVYSGKWRVRII